MWKWFRRIALTGIATATALVAMLAYVVFFDFDAVDADMLRKLTADEGQVKSFVSVRADRWDLVCNFGSYENASKLRQFEPSIGTRMRVLPRDVWLRDGEVGLAFVDLRKREISVVLIGHHSGGAVQQIKGPRCLNRERAYFRTTQFKPPPDSAFPDSAFYELRMIEQEGAPAGAAARDR